MANNSKLCFGPYVLDEANECLWREGKAIALRPKAYGVLHFLISHPGVLVTKQQLLDAVWPETFVGDSVLKDSIRQLRDALGDEAKAPQFIETAHRRGYRFIAHLSDVPKTDSPISLLEIGASSRFSPYNVVSEDFISSDILGRDENLAQLHDWLKKTLEGRRQTIFVTGEAGIGKTTLVESFLRDVGGNVEILIGRGQCLEQYGAGEAYLPVLDAFSKLAREPFGSIVVENLRHLAPSWLVQLPRLLSESELQKLREQISQASRERMLREMTETIEAISTVRPLVLFLEDLHWSDYSTIDLISYLARRREPASVMVIATYRPVELVLSDHPLKETKQELQMHRFCNELPLEYLEEESIAAFLDCKFPSNSFPGNLAEMIYRHTEGNPLFMVNVVDYLVNLNLILEREGKYVLAQQVHEIELGVPENIRHLIETHVERLTEEEQRVLEGASIVGMDCSAVAIAAGLNSDVIRIEEVCDGLARRRHFLLPAYLAELPDGTITPRYTFIHSTYMDVIYNRIAPTKRSQIHARIAQRGEAIYGDGVGVIAAELAVHFEQAHDEQKAIKYLQLAAENAESRSARYEAISLARRGLALLSTMDRSEEVAAHEEKFANRISALQSNREK